MSDIDFSANNCFVCGPDNPIGLKIKFTIDDDDICRGHFTSMENHVGYQNTTHGGIIFSLLDDVMANWLFLKNQVAQTAQCDLRYRQVLPVDEPVILEGWCEKQRSRVAFMKGQVILASNSTIVAESSAKFMLLKD